jgi:diguanylate cyclase (GGDEF)-like protein/PAS domain S-box-containing protein
MDAETSREAGRGRRITLGIELFERIVNRSFEAIIVVDDQRRVVFWNNAAENIFGYGEEFMLGKDMHDYITPERYRPTAKAAHTRYLQTGIGSALGRLVEIEGLHASGHEFWVELGLNDVLVEGNRWAFAIIRDVTARKAMEEQLVHQARNDALTGIPNRRCFEDALQGAVGRDATVLFVDVDRLKEINDRFGHEAGDRAIVAVSEVVARCFADAEICARIGGDEFGVVYRDADAELVERRCTRALAEARETRLADYPAVTLSLSIGAAFAAGKRFTDPRQLLRAADDALIAGKQGGRARYVLRS